MRPRRTEYEPQTLSAFKLRKVLTIAQLCARLRLSVPTVRRRLKQWRTLSSYNASGRYYRGLSKPPLFFGIVTNLLQVYGTS